MVKRIFVVDDEPDVCFVLEKVLSENGYVVDSYEDPLLALEKFKAHYYMLYFQTWLTKSCTNMPDTFCLVLVYQ
jgi:DNA-binding response OmpR family regulator